LGANTWLTHQNLNLVNAIRIGNFIGTLPVGENGKSPGIICNNHLCIRVSIDISQPLVPGFLLPRQGCSSIWVKFLYERLSDYCTLCGLIGHCKTLCTASPTPGSQVRYGFSLRGYRHPGIRSSLPTRHDHQAVIDSRSSLLSTENHATVLFLSGCSSANRAVVQTLVPL
jgi:hypothetical protein